MTNHTHAPQSAPHAETLTRQGWCIIRDALPASVLADLETALEPHFACTPFSKGLFYGETTKRFGRVLSRAPASALLATHPLILEVADRVLGRWCDHIQLNLVQAIEIHPGEQAQVPHRDQDMWHAEKGRFEYVINAMWPITPFRAENGATRIWPHSHGSRALEAPPMSEPVVAEADPGSAILFLGSTLHAAGANTTDTPRRAIVTGYSLGWLKAYENPYLAYPPQIAREFPPVLAALLGYRQHRPNLGNFEGQCPSILLGDTIPEDIAATDALLPEQTEMIRGWREEQQASEPSR